MVLGAHVRTWVVRLAANRYRRILVAGLVTLLVSGAFLALIALTQRREQRALESDTDTIVSQGAQQLLRAIESRRGTLTFIRDTLNRSADLTGSQLRALGQSATEHTRHLLGTGLTREHAPPIWWYGPAPLTARQASQLNHAIIKRQSLRGVWHVPSTFSVTTDADRPFLVMLVPLRNPVYRHCAVTGVFDLKPLLEDFVSSRLLQHHPVQVLEGDTLLYRSSDWAAPRRPDDRQIIVEETITADATRWTLQMQPGSTRVAQTLSWFNLLVVGLSIIAGGGLTVIVWILAIRTWILQRAVTRRTAALRRTSERLRQLATTDELTGLHNRRFFLNRWNWEHDRAKRYQRPLACLMIDVNGFKQVNDTLGHQIGDLVLKDVAKELRAALRQSDILARFGGDEFVIALPETSMAQAELVADKLRKVSIPVSSTNARRVPPVSLSVGISRVEPSNEDPLKTLQAADQSLYADKDRRHPKASETRR